MKIQMPKKTKSHLDLEIDRLISTMESWQGSEEEYTTMVKNLDVLVKLKTVESSRRVSPDTLAVVGANLLGIVLVLKYEELNVLTSKAMAFVAKPRI